MTSTSEKAKKYFEMLGQSDALEKVFEDVQQKKPNKSIVYNTIPGPLSWSKDAHQKRMDFLKSITGSEPDYLTFQKIFDDPASLQGNL